MSRVVIHADGPTGMGCVTEVDGARIGHLTGVEVRIGTVEPNRVTLDVLALTETDIDVQGDVVYRAGTVLSDGRFVQAVGPTWAEAFRALANHIDGAS